MLKYLNRVPFPLLLSMASLAAFGGFLFYLYAARQPASGPVQIVRAPDGPIKVRPEDLGGMDVPHRDLTVLEAAEGEPATPPKLAAPPEEPMDREALGQEASPPAGQDDPLGEQIAQLLAIPPGETAWHVQLAALSDVEKAQAYWDRLLEDHPRLLRGLSHQIEPTTARGQRFFRLRAGPLADEAAADRLCASLEAEAVGCLTVAPPS